jgi:hypothetical protein
MLAALPRLVLALLRPKRRPWNRHEAQSAGGQRRVSPRLAGRPKQPEVALERRPCTLSIPTRELTRSSPSWRHCPAWCWHCRLSTQAQRRSMWRTYTWGRCGEPLQRQPSFRCPLQVCARKLVGQAPNLQTLWALPSFILAMSTRFGDAVQRGSQTFAVRCRCAHASIWARRPVCKTCWRCLGGVLAVPLGYDTDVWTHTNTNMYLGPLQRAAKETAKLPPSAACACTPVCARKHMCAGMHASMCVQACMANARHCPVLIVAHRAPLSA